MNKISKSTHLNNSKKISLLVMLVFLLIGTGCHHEDNEKERPAGFSGFALKSEKTEPPTTPEITPTSMYDVSLVTEIYVFGNPDSVYNGATKPSTFENKEPWYIYMLYTYHWNDAKGVSPVGTITLQEEGGTVYGPWETIPLNGQGGVPNAYWAALPINFVLPPGKYTVIDSDPSTWSQNSGTDGAGFFWVNGIRLDN